MIQDSRAGESFTLSSSITPFTSTWLLCQMSYNVSKLCVPITSFLWRNYGDFSGARPCFSLTFSSLFLCFKTMLWTLLHPQKIKTSSSFMMWNIYRCINQLYGTAWTEEEYGLEGRKIPNIYLKQHEYYFWEKNHFFFLSLDTRCSLQLVHLPPTPDPPVNFDIFSLV